MSKLEVVAAAPVLDFNYDWENLVRKVLYESSVDYSKIDFYYGEFFSKQLYLKNIALKFSIALNVKNSSRLPPLQVKKINNMNCYFVFYTKIIPREISNEDTYRFIFTLSTLNQEMKRIQTWLLLK